MSDDEDSVICTPTDVKETADIARNAVIPTKWKHRYYGCCFFFFVVLMM